MYILGQQDERTPSNLLRSRSGESVTAVGPAAGFLRRCRGGGGSTSVAYGHSGEATAPPSAAAARRCDDAAVVGKRMRRSPSAAVSAPSSGMAVAADRACRVCMWASARVRGEGSRGGSIRGAAVQFCAFQFQNARRRRDRRREPLFAPPSVGRSIDRSIDPAGPRREAPGRRHEDGRGLAADGRRRAIELISIEEAGALPSNQTQRLLPTAVTLAMFRVVV